jgi:hypothetical protein
VIAVVMLARVGVVVVKFALPVRAATIAWALLSKSLSDNLENPVLSLFTPCATWSDGASSEKPYKNLIFPSEPKCPSYESRHNPYESRHDWFSASYESRGGSYELFRHSYGPFWDSYESISDSLGSLRDPNRSFSDSYESFSHSYRSFLDRYRSFGDSYGPPSNPYRPPSDSYDSFCNSYVAENDPLGTRMANCVSRCFWGSARTKIPKKLCAETDP